MSRSLPKLLPEPVSVQEHIEVLLRGFWGRPVLAETFGFNQASPTKVVRAIQDRHERDPGI